ncbi:MAG: hypothetical protein KAJ95_06380 [Gammaproteobacteria bacterium]|nr:hypothetical protein [Gammaproteobacteria bacterium]
MLGTNPYPFTRLIDKVIEWVEQTDEHVIVQSGNTPVPAGKIESYPFMPHSKITELMLQADVVITQGGFGSLQDCMQLGVKTVAVPRLIEKGESQDDQKEIVSALAEENLVVPLYDVEDLGDAINTARKLEIKSVVTTELPEHIAETVSRILG